MIQFLVSMSIERRTQKKDQERRGRIEFFKGAAVGASMLAGGLAGTYEGVKNGQENINAHILSPAAIYQLKQEGGATDQDIAKLERVLGQRLLSELKALMKSG